MNDLNTNNNNNNNNNETLKVNDSNNIILDNEYVKQCDSFLKQFETNKIDKNFKKGLYIYGDYGIGKTTFIKSYLKMKNYEVIYIDYINDEIKKNIEQIVNNQISSTCIMSHFINKKRLIVVIDDIYQLNICDKNNILSIVKCLRVKKKIKEGVIINNIPIICINQYHVDKKIKELLKICYTLEMKPLSNKNIEEIICKLFHDNYIFKTWRDKSNDTEYKKIMYSLFSKYNGNIHKIKNEIESVCIIYSNKYPVINTHNNTIFLNDINSYIYDITKHDITHIDNSIRDIVYILLNKHIDIKKHEQILNDTDRTSVSLLFHENMIDHLKSNVSDNILHYNTLLDNIVFADYIDRITFQKQLWILNESSSIIKNIINNRNLIKFKKNNINSKNNMKEYNLSTIDIENEVRFTKILTKYSSEYNNYTFISMMCFKLLMDEKDIMYLFRYIDKNDLLKNISYERISHANISILDIKRVIRIIHHHMGIDENT